MLKNYMGILNFNENEDRLKRLTRSRPVASIPIGGRYRIVDFILSNMVNAGVENIGIFTKSRSRSLVDHLSNGKPWDLDRKRDGIRVFNFAVGNPSLEDVEMFTNNIEYLQLSRQENVIIAPSYMICNIDFKEAVEFHERSGGDITLLYKKANNANTSFIGCDVANIDLQGRVLSVGKNLGTEVSSNIALEMYIMRKSLFIDLIYKCIQTGMCRKVKHAIYRSLEEYKVLSYEFKGYVECVNSVNAYYKANMDMLDVKVNKELFFNKGLIYTKAKDEAPTKYSKTSKVSNSLISNGCIIEGTVENCILSRKVKVRKGAVLKNCIIMQNCEIGEDSRLFNIITDKNVVIKNQRILHGDDELPLVIEKEVPSINYNS